MVIRGQTDIGIGIILSPTLFSLSVLRQFAPFLSRLGTPWLRRKIVDWTPNKAIQKIKVSGLPYPTTRTANRPVSLIFTQNMSDIMDSTARSILREKQILMNKPDLYETNFGNVEEDKDIISVLRGFYFSPATDSPWLLMITYAQFVRMRRLQWEKSFQSRS